MSWCSEQLRLFKNFFFYLLQVTSQSLVRQLKNRSVNDKPNTNVISLWTDYMDIRSRNRVFLSKNEAGANLIFMQISCCWCISLSLKTPVYQTNTFLLPLSHILTGHGSVVISWCLHSIDPSGYKHNIHVKNRKFRCLYPFFLQ